MGLNLSNLPKLINKDTIVIADNQAKPILTPVMRLLFNKDVGAVNATKLTREFMNYDITVKRLVLEGSSQFEKFGDMTYSLDEKTLPLFKMADTVKAGDLDEINESVLVNSNFTDLNSLNTFQGWFNNRYNIAFQHLALTRENIAAQAVSGSISHTVVTEENTTEAYTLDLGTVVNITAATGGAKDWANSSTSLQTIMGDVEKAFKYYQDNVDRTAQKSRTIMCLNSANYYAVRGKAQALQSIDNMKYQLISDVSDFWFSVDGWIFVLETFKYKSGADFSVDSEALPAKTCQFINLDNNHKFRYFKYANFNNPAYQSQANSTLRMYALSQLGGTPLGELALMFFISRFMPLFNTRASCYLQVNP